jgi:NCS1 family nucleobase:cation symporter-1
VRIAATDMHRIAAGVNTTAWALGSSHLAAGLDAGGAIGGVLVGGIVAGIVAFLCGEPGVKYHLGFPMMSRATFGMYGSYFVISIKIFVNFIFCGIQSYWGGLAAKVVLAALFPSFHNMANTLPASALITTTQLIGFLCYMIIFTPLMFIHPSRMQPVLYAAFYMVTAAMFGLFIWALAANGGGSMPKPAKQISSADRSFRILLAISSVAGGWTGSSIR